MMLSYVLKASTTNEISYRKLNFTKKEDVFFFYYLESPSIKEKLK